MEEYFSKIRRTESGHNFQALPVVIQYNGRSYERAKKMSAIDIISEAYPWELPLKHAQPLVDRYNLTVVGENSHITEVCAQFGVIFDGFPTASIATHPHYKVVAFEIETTGVLFFDNSSAEAEGHQYLFNDLTVPFDLPLWILCLVSCFFMSVLLKIVYELQFQLAILASVASLIGISVSTLRGGKHGILYITWLLGGVLICSAYSTVLHSNVVVPTEMSTSKNISELHASNYSVIGTSLFSVYGNFYNQYQQTLEMVRRSSESVHDSTLTVFENYKKLLEMLDRKAYPYKEQYKLIRGNKTALFGDMHNLNVLRHVVTAEQRQKLKFTQENFFPNMKNSVFQLHHAPIISDGFKRLISNGIFRYWENIRFLADRLAWWRVLKPILRESWNREKHGSVSMSDTLLWATFHLLMLGVCVGILALSIELVLHTLSLL